MHALGGLWSRASGTVGYWCRVGGVPVMIVAGLLSSGPVTAGTAGWPTAGIGLAVLFALFSVALGLVGYRWAVSDDETRETDEESPVVDAADRETGEESPVVDEGDDSARGTAYDTPEPGDGDTPGDTGHTDSETVATEGAVDGSADSLATADGSAPNGRSALADGAGEPASVESPRLTGDPGLFSDPDSDETRVLELLEASDGRMKQAQIIEETTWSKSKVSTLLSEMAEEGTITKLRLGRENIICLDGEEPELALSPSDDEQGRV